MSLASLVGVLLAVVKLGALLSSRACQIRKKYTEREPATASKPLRFIDIEKGVVVEENDEWTKLSAEEQNTYIEDAIKFQAMHEVHLHFW